MIERKKLQCHATGASQKESAASDQDLTPITAAAERVAYRPKCKQQTATNSCVRIGSKTHSSLHKMQLLFFAAPEIRK